MQTDGALPTTMSKLEADMSTPIAAPDPFVARYLDGGRAIPWMTRGLLMAVATAAALFLASLVLA